MLQLCKFFILPKIILRINYNSARPWYNSDSDCSLSKYSGLCYDTDEKATVIYKSHYLSF